MRQVTILGSTGSIGTQALQIIAQHADRFAVSGLAAGGSNIDLLAEQVQAFSVPTCAVPTAAACAELSERLPADLQVEILIGTEGVEELAARATDVVLNGIAGARGLAPTLAALSAGNQLALANKESLIIGGQLVLAAAVEGQIIPVDSEHSALAQSLLAGKMAEVNRLILTASGGPFRGYSFQELADVTVEQALNHPTWQMGPLVTINSATLVNKGLELIEAYLLFDIDLDRIEVVVHPQSVVHSMVEFHDGATMVQASPPDMRLPIALGIDWPNRHRDVSPKCDWTQPTSWDFAPVDNKVFPSIDLARHAIEVGSLGPAVFNAADEVAVSAFLDRQIDFPSIVSLIEKTLTRYTAESQVTGTPSYEEVLAADTWARAQCAELITGG